jgi:hypothetical protein
MRMNLKRRRGLRSTAFLSAAVLVAGGVAATMGAANGAITSGGGLNEQDVPSFFKDSRGVALALCTDANENLCDPPLDDHVGAYFSAEATPGPWRIIYGVEAINDPVDGLMVSNGSRFRATNLRPNTVYTIKDPWDTIKVLTDDTGTADRRIETDGTFGTVKNGHVKTFLHAVSRRGAAFIGSHVLTTQVFGSPSGFNKVKITGGGRTWSTAQFSLMGQKRADTAMTSINKRALELGNGKRADVVTKTVRYASFGTAAARPTVRKGGTNPGAFTVQNQCASQAPGTGCNIVVKFAPRQNAGVKKAFLVIDDNGLAAPRKVSLKGVGLRR